VPRPAEVDPPEGGRLRGGEGDPGRLAAAMALALLPALAVSTAYALPGLPIGTGVYWSLAAWAARELGAPPADAAAMAVLSHAAMVGTNLLVGGASALLRRGALSELVRRRREVERLARTPRNASPRAPT
jgi:hypothetical protein